MIWISLATWNSKHGHFLTWKRVYRKGYVWTPFCHISKRYDSWLGFWKATKPDWEISVPDGHSGTASVTYKGTVVPGITHLVYHLSTDGPGELSLTISPHALDAAMEIIHDALKTSCE